MDAATQHHYNGALYLIGTEYTDVSSMHATGLNPSTMQFMPGDSRGSLEAEQTRVVLDHGPCVGNELATIANEATLAFCSRGMISDRAILFGPHLSLIPQVLAVALRDSVDRSVVMRCDA